MAIDQQGSGKHSVFPASEIGRIEEIYTNRNYDSDRDYNDTNLVYLHRTQSVEVAAIDAMNKIGLIQKLGELKILDYGCGNGRWMSRWLTWGATPGNMAATDIRESALKCASDHVPQADIRLATENGLDYPSGSFDLVYQNLVFSSILDKAYRKNAAREIARVLKPGGRLLWYDFTFNNPSNKNVRKVSFSEVQSLFPDFQVEYYKKIVLAPPLARFLVPSFWAVADIFEMLPFFRTHLFMVLRKSEPQVRANGEIRIRRAISGDIHKIVDVHMQAFPGFPLTMLGAPFLMVLYGNFVAHKDGICYVAECGNEIIGFSAGAIRPHRFFRNMFAMKGLHFLIASVRALFKHPRLAASSLQRALFYRGERPEEIPDTDTCLVSSMGVAPAYAGEGVGSRLLEELCQEALRRGMTSAYLTTDAHHNASVNEFYRHRGFELASKIERTDSDRTMNLYIRKL